MRIVMVFCLLVNSFLLPCLTRCGHRVGASNQDVYNQNSQSSEDMQINT